MTEQMLHDSAGTIALPSARSIRAYREQAPAMAAEVTRRLRERPDREQLIGASNEAAMELNHRNHTQFIAAWLEHPEPRVLVETVLWVYRSYQSHGFSLAYWPVQLDLWLREITARLDAEAAGELRPLYDWLLWQHATFAALSAEQAGDAAGDSRAELHGEASNEASRPAA